MATRNDRQAARNAAADATTTAKPRKAADAKARAPKAADTAKAQAVPAPAGFVATGHDLLGAFVRYGRKLRSNGHHVVGYDTKHASTTAERRQVAAWQGRGLTGRYVVVDLDSDLAASSDTWAVAYAATATWGVPAEREPAKSVATHVLPTNVGTLAMPPKAPKPAAEPTEAAAPAKRSTKAKAPTEAKAAPAKRTKAAKAPATA